MFRYSKITIGAVLTASAIGSAIFFTQNASAKPSMCPETWPVTMQSYIERDLSNNLIRINYAALSQSSEAKKMLDDYIDHLQSLNPEKMSPDEAIAFWANLYNAVTIDVIVENYPVKSIKEIKSSLVNFGPWDLKLVTVNDKRLSLNDIEHGILRKQYPSLMIHYMVNCASIGCPNIKVGEWRAETLKDDQVQAARDFINSPRGVSLIGDSLVLSSIYKWFKEDFGTTESNILEHIKLYADPDLSIKLNKDIKIKAYDYDWDLNATKTSPPS